MASDLDFSPPEVPEPTFLENLLRYGLFLGAIFQLICVLAIIVPVPKSYEAEAEPSEPRSAEGTRKSKATAPSASKRPKKETKKKR
ncbi:protein MANBAL isoform 3-T3 [Trichechus inunguis]|uniref:Protein MANBAL n=1 Tax=Trichechus manatus latirostris TaxID=127582 RepID=A0A2Y9D9I9_TRIMA|nr:protein MANBAL [Trichechus manatus latirostris]